MPDIDGANLAQALAVGSGQGSAERPRFILLTSSDADTVAGVGECIDGLIQKPIRAQHLVRMMNSVLAGSAAALPKPPSVIAEVPRVNARPVLVVEDNPVNQEVMRESLLQLGYRAKVVDNGQMAVDELARNTYPLIFMDCQMPVLDGYQATREIRRREQGGSRVPIIAVTAHAFESERDKVLAAGMDGYISKPIKQSALLEALQRWWPDGVRDEAPPSSLAASSTRSRRPSSAPPIQPAEAVVRAFMRVVPEQIAEIEAAIAGGDPRAVAAAAHKLKGGCLALGEATMATLCAQLEKSPDNRASLCAQLSKEFERVASRWTEKATLASSGTG
jgi:CheY-like chemotaxis protein/HPt (histidine-containing phosphotransfer) domain-containing protein